MFALIYPIALIYEFAIYSFLSLQMKIVDFFLRLGIFNFWYNIKTKQVVNEKNEVIPPEAPLKAEVASATTSVYAEPLQLHHILGRGLIASASLTCKAFSSFNLGNLVWQFEVPFIYKPFVALGVNLFNKTIQVVEFKSDKTISNLQTDDIVQGYKSYTCMDLQTAAKCLGAGLFDSKLKGLYILNNANQFIPAPLWYMLGKPKLQLKDAEIDMDKLRKYMDISEDPDVDLAGFMYTCGIDMDIGQLGSEVIVCGEYKDGENL